MKKKKFIDYKFTYTYTLTIEFKLYFNTITPAPDNNNNNNTHTDLLNLRDLQMIYPYLSPLTPNWTSVSIPVVVMSQDSKNLSKNTPVIKIFSNGKLTISKCQTLESGYNTLYKFLQSIRSCLKKWNHTTTANEHTNNNTSSPSINGKCMKITCYISICIDHPYTINIDQLYNYIPHLNCKYHHNHSKNNGNNLLTITHMNNTTLTIYGNGTITSSGMIPVNKDTTKWIYDYMRSTYFKLQPGICIK